MPTVRIDARRIVDWDTLHDVFAEAFGFPDFYGRNMDAWIDCMTSLDEPGDGLTAVHGSAADPVVLQIDHAEALPEAIFLAIVECAAFVNWRRIEVGRPAVLMLSCHRSRRA